MSNTFKHIRDSDIRYVETELNRLYSISDSTADSFGIIVYEGVSGSSADYAWTGSGESNGIQKRLSWALANQVIFEEKKLSNGTYIQEESTEPGLSMSIMSIPPEIYGIGIKPGSIILTDDNTSEAYVDIWNGTKYGQIYSASEGIATVDYSRGLIAITHQDHVDIFGNYTLVFRNRMPLRSYEYTCRIGSDEFLMTLNPSAMSGALSESTFIPAGFCTNSAWSPYITTVGLYNEDNELVVVAKLSQPIKKPYQYNLNIITRFDI